MAEPVYEEHRSLPAPPLRPYLGSYTGYRMSGFEPGVHYGMPSASLTAVIAFGYPVDLVRVPGHKQGPEAFPSVVGGLHDRAVSIRHDGTSHGIQIDITPAGARRFFGLPAGELSGYLVSWPDLLGHLGTQLVERLIEATDWPARFATLDELLGQALSGDGETRPEVAHAWSTITASHGRVEIGSLATEVGWSRRHLADRFRREYGLSPKTVARIARFNRATKLLKAAPERSLADVAAVCGYTDQPHMTRDWRAFADQTPAAWLAEEVFPSVQDHSALVG